MANRERILITGASGFVGASLARRLIAAGHEVHLMLRTGSNLWRLAGLAGQYATHLADLRDLPTVRGAVDACRPEVVYHLAADGVRRQPQERADLATQNFLGTLHLLEALSRHDYRALVHAGSGAEYGHRRRPIREGGRLAPRGDYAVSKAAATLLCQAEARKGRPVTIVRIFTAYGPWEDPARLVPYVMGCCIRGERPRLTSGRQARDFIHIDDCVELFERAAQLPRARGRILHAGTGRSRTVRQMVETLLEVCGKGEPGADFGARPDRLDEPRRCVADIEKTVAWTGWRPRYDLREGVEHVWNWYRSVAGRAA
ncbi:MAG TPA: NAD(P)-dependent oxidoreductase [Pirellulales bacterium]|nr:NAD(P)-dependent oxidoreductase [Pirellulales bacterium]